MKNSKADALFEQLTTRVKPDAIVELRSVYLFAKKKHEGQERKSGDLYITHPVSVAIILAEMGFGMATLKAALLHDVVEDCGVTSEEIEEHFGKVVTCIVNGVTKISTLKKTTLSHGHKDNVKYESFLKFIFAISEDIRVVIVKIADRLHNMRTLEYFNEKKRRRYSKETMDIYIPLANRLGFTVIKSELEDLCFKYFAPKAYYRIKALVEEKRSERKQKIQDAIEFLVHKLSPYKIPMEISGRPKHFYSIYKKMQRKGLTFDEIFDLLAFRIITDTKEHCYLLLGLIHSIWFPKGSRFKDYVASPKPNNYQSLHTTVVNSKGDLIEVQIRTLEMHQVAERGIAAHWSYKEGNESILAEGLSLYSFFQELIETTKHEGSAQEHYDSIKNKLLKNTIFVRTPEGKVVELPKGSTPVDFAYAIHSEVGNTCIGAKVNGRMVPLSQELSTEDVLYIITQKNAHPSADWLKYVKTSKAKNKIKHWIKASLTDFYINEAKNQVSKALKEYGLSLTKFQKKYLTTENLKKLNYKDDKTLLVDVGSNELKISTLFNKTGLSGTGKVPQKQVQKKTKTRIPESYKIIGIEDIQFHLAKCCQATHEDPICGIITPGHGISVHKRNCPNAKNANPEKVLSLTWDIENQSASDPIISKESLLRIRINEHFQELFEHLKSMTFYLARCCNPGQNDSIRGFFSKTRRGISVHKASCFHIKNRQKSHEPCYRMFFESPNDSTVHYGKLTIKVPHRHHVNSILKVICRLNFTLVNFYKIIGPREATLELFISFENLKKTEINQRIDKLRQTLNNIERNIEVDFQQKKFSFIISCN